jgi:hypothetical protein
MVKQPYLKGGQFAPASGGLFVPAKVVFLTGIGVVSLLRRQVVNLADFSNY